MLETREEASNQLIRTAAVDAFDREWAGECPHRTPRAEARPALSNLDTVSTPGHDRSWACGCGTCLHVCPDS